MSKDFASLTLSTALLDNLKSLDYLHMTPIQAESLPAVLAGKDVLAQAKTGSGKTAAFALGILHHLDSSSYQTQALVICPTRELADQVTTEVRRLARSLSNIKILSLCGGKPMAAQLASLQHAPHIVVGTPGRLLKHLQKGSLSLAHLNTLVLDEADRMLDMGFFEDISAIIEQTPSARQTLLFSATYPDEIMAISQSIQQQPESILLKTPHDNSKIKQLLVETSPAEKTSTLIRLLRHFHPESSMVFCNRKQQCQDLAQELWSQGFHALALHGDLDQRDRDQVLVQFSNNSSSILVATDVASRGLDIKDLTAVINYDLSHDTENHIHRIGRTGRADKEGLAITLSVSRESSRIAAIETYQGSRFERLKTDSLRPSQTGKLKPSMTTLRIHAGRKDKLRPGDILGALTSNTELNGAQIGKIKLFDKIAFVAVDSDIAKLALAILESGKIKGRSFRIRRLR